MLQDTYQFSPTRTDFELRLVGDQKPANPFPVISLAQRLSEAEKLIIGLENLLTLSIDRERELTIDLAAIKTMNLGLRVDALNYEIALTALQNRRTPPLMTGIASDQPIVSEAPQAQARQQRIGIFGLLFGRH